MITIVVALIAAIAAIVAPVLTACINNLGAYRLKMCDLFFNANLSAYSDFVRIAESFPEFPTEADLKRLNAAWSQTLLFSTKPTRTAIAVYVGYLFHSPVPPERNDEFAAARLDALDLIQDELKAYKAYKKQRRK